MLGAWEFTVFGNIFMGIMAIGGVCCMVYAVGSSMANSSPADEGQLAAQGQLEDKACDAGKKAA
jgi:hypothetical protein